ncbi:MAG: hypothetical protein Q7R91_01525 [bacterium]|nr:hypothetical protein [bacterium]
MSLDDFIAKTIEAILSFCGEHFTPLDSEERAQSITSMLTSLRGKKVPKRFLGFLETTKNPQVLIEDAFANIKGSSMMFQFHSAPNKLQKEDILQHAGAVVAQQIVFDIFGPIIETPAGPVLKFTDDLVQIYTFLQQKIDQAAVENSAEQESNGNGLSPITLREEEKKALIQKHTDTLFSIPLFIQKISKKETECGQYL